MKNCYNPGCTNITVNPKYCGLSCGNTHRGILNEEKYYLNPILCRRPHCTNPIEFKSRNINNFCSRICAAILNNSKKDYTKIKTGPKKDLNRLNRPKWKRAAQVKTCLGCNRYFITNTYRKTCDDECYRSFQSSNLKLKIYNGYNPKLNRGRGKKSYMEDSFEKWLIENGVTSFKTETPFKRKDKGRTYFADFYFPELNLIIELDGSQHLKTKEKDIERDRYITDTYGITITRISSSEYRKKTKINEIKILLGI